MDEVRLYNRALNANEVKAYTFSCRDALPCTNWLKTDGSNFRSGVEIGDLDVSGNQLTVECQFNAASLLIFPAAGGDLVSKHGDPNNVNYLLRPERAEITTSNGYFVTPPVCPIELNKTYHAAMVYDGSTLKFYRNGFLLSQAPCTGNMFQNSLRTMIGATAYTLDFNFTGFTGIINEVRIWNTVRSGDELKQYMDKPLTNPATQPGLLAYYTFDNTINKQGNAAWN